MARQSPLSVALPCLLALSGPRGTLAAESVGSSGVQERIERVTGCLTTAVVRKDAPLPCRTLRERMAMARVPGVSIAVIRGGAIEWARGFGAAAEGGPAITAETLFQAGSISKPVTALAALRLVEEGRLTLDADVDRVLTSWEVPASAAAPSAVVTLRELLTHTAGLTVHGFPGYAAGEPVPTLVQILNGDKPANTDPVVLDAPPGSRWRYSGGGYTVLQQLLIDVSGQPFPVLMHDVVLAPLGMARSTYEQPLPAPLRADAATPYARDGAPIPGGAHTYPEMAAAGLWTTPTDLARFAIGIQRALRGGDASLISARMAEAMLTPGLGRWGLGFAIGGRRENPYFTHGGIDAGFESLLVAYRDTGDGAVVMTNAEGGEALAAAVLRSIASVYGWPDFGPEARAVVDVDPALLRNYVGVYRLAPAAEMRITLSGSQLTAQVAGQDAVPLYPDSPTTFFTTAADAEVAFSVGGDDPHLVLHQGGRSLRAEREP